MEILAINSLNLERRNKAITSKDSGLNFNNVLSNKIGEKVSKINNMNKNDSNISDEFKNRKDEIAALRKEYNENSEWNATDCIPKLNPDLMDTILNLNIKNNSIYYTDGKLNINRITKDCGIDLNNITPIELQSLKEELKSEGLIDTNLEYNLSQFISRACADTFSKGNYSLDDAYNNIPFSICEKLNYFKQIDSRFSIFDNSIGVISDFFNFRYLF